MLTKQQKIYIEESIVLKIKTTKEDIVLLMFQQQLQTVGKAYSLLALI